MYHATPDTIAIAAGTIDDDKILAELPERSNHIFVAEKAAWFTIPEDGLKRYMGFPEGVQSVIDAGSQERVEDPA